VETREVAEALLDDYGLDPVSIEPVTGGQDDEAQVYRVETRDPVARYLVKVRPASSRATSPLPSRATSTTRALDMWSRRCSRAAAASHRRTRASR
jgi:hypothetical protein